MYIQLVYNLSCLEWLTLFTGENVVISALSNLSVFIIAGSSCWKESLVLVTSSIKPSQDEKWCLKNKEKMRDEQNYLKIRIYVYVHIYVHMDFIMYINCPKIYDF